MDTVEVKTFVPAEDFELSKRSSSFLLRRFYVKQHADNFVTHTLVQDVEAWWAHVERAQLASRYGV